MALPPHIKESEVKSVTHTLKNAFLAILKYPPRACWGVGRVRLVEEGGNVFLNRMWRRPLEGRCAVCTQPCAAEYQDRLKDVLTDLGAHTQASQALREVRRAAAAPVTQTVGDRAAPARFAPRGQAKRCPLPYKVSFG